MESSVTGSILPQQEEGGHKAGKPQIVGIGASAGGLEALSQLVANLPADLGCAYVIAQHMSPAHRSMMVDILSRETNLPVSEIVDGGFPELDAIHIIPPGHNLVFKEGHFRLQRPSPEVSPKPSINLLFQSLAESFDERAVGVILSGTGSDGTAGLKAIKAAGGTTFVQAPETAKYEGMPGSAIDAGVADHILPPDQMGGHLRRLVCFPTLVTAIANWQESPPELDSIFDRVRSHTGIDFSSYKLSTVLRRLQRRMLATNAETLSAYQAYLDEHPAELDALAKETLISVTEFFRDREAFRALERQVRDLLSLRSADEEIRVWSVGCATGEEAYSLAILFAEAMGDRFSKATLQVFATDIDQDALAVGRAGQYSAASLAELPAPLLNKYFVPCEKGYELVKPLRDCVVFARQDITIDPPFVRLDLIACRNVMIYFNAVLQSKVLSVLQYALKDDGVLFLGRSETVTQQESMFSVLDRRSRLYRPRKENSTRQSSVRLTRGKLPVVSPASSRHDPSYERYFLNAVASHHAAHGLLVDAVGQILHTHGTLSPFLEFPTGTPDLNVSRMVTAELRQEVLTVLHRARREGVAVYSRKRRIARLDQETWRVGAWPAGKLRDSELFLIVFEPVKKMLPADADNDADVERFADDQTELELISTREHLQSMVEEMAASNEEMQALTEEVQAANEELQASNEELEATNEELQATNEELISVNEESLIKSAELAAMNADFESVYNTMDFPVLVFDADLYAKRANVAAFNAFPLPVSVAGQHIARLQLPVWLGQVETRLANVVKEAKKTTYTAHDADRTFQVYITPTLNTKGMVQSVVLVVTDSTKLIQAHAREREMREQLLAIMNNSPSVVTLKDTRGRYEFVNHRFVDISRRPLDEILGATDAQLFSPEVAKIMRNGDLEVLKQLDHVDTVEEFEIDHKYLVFMVTRFPIFDAQGVVKSICTQAMDITAKRHAEEQLRLAAKVFDRAGEAIVITDAHNNIITVNESFTQITGYALNEIIGKTPSVLNSGKHGKDFYDAMWRSLHEHGWWQGEIINKRKSGELYPEWLTINAVFGQNNEVQNYVAIFSDITAIKSSQRKIEFMATHDELTGLPNRSLLMDRLKHGLSNAQRQKQRLAVCFIDLDNFKNINDTLGHDAGDLLLKEATNRLKSCIRDSDTLARLGGDEFVALLMDVDLEEINQIASRIVDFLSASFHIRDHQLFVSASIGVSLFPEDGEDSTTLLKNADTAMYRAKERGKNQYQFFAEEMKVVALQRLTLETGLRQAIDNDHFRMVFQPQVDIHTGQIIGAESLIRWRDPFLGEVSPGQFIPAAESAGLITTIGEIVLNKVLGQIKQWRLQQVVVPPISINISAHQFRDVGFANHFLALLAQYSIPPDQVCIEITESVLMEGLENVRKVLVAIESAGVTISIDDFGTGYSSLMYLKQLPIHELKVDRSFVDGIAEGGDDLAITTAIINMAHALGMRVVAEGVETVGQTTALQKLGCQVAQGYLFHRPMESADFLLLMTRRQNLEQ